MIKLILGGFPCTQFSLAQKKNRINKVDFTADEFVEFHNNDKLWYQHIAEFEKYIGNKLGIEDYKFAEGLQLFFNCIAAIDRTKEQYPNDKVYYMFENVSSMQKEIKQTLTEILNKLYGGVSTEINSALVSAQTRKRIYFTNYGEIPQPEDKGILLKDILESGIIDKEKAYALKHQAGNARDYIKKHHMAVAFEPCVFIGDCKTIEVQMPKIVEKYGEVPEMFNAYNASKIEDKSPTLSTGSMVTSSCATCKFEPVAIGYRSRLKDGKNVKRYEANPSGKANALTTAITDSMVAEPVILNMPTYEFSNEYFKGGFESSLIGMTTKGEGKYRNGNQPSQQYRVYSSEGKSQVVNTLGNENYIIPIHIEITEDMEVEELYGGNLKVDGKLIYKVENGLIPFKEDFYPINLPDGYYLIRKLTVKESMRLQTIPEWYEFPVSDTQAYKMLGNGWTRDVISHILSFIPNIKDEEIDVLSLYDGMSCGKLALMDLGCEKHINTYRAYEIDPYAIKTTQHNFPDTIQCGDAFKVRDDDWQV